VPPAVSVRVADERDLPALTRLRRDWAAERIGVGGDAEFDRAFAAWWRAESPRRVFWLAEAGTERAGFTAVGSLNVVEVDGMPRPGATAGRWGYVGNAFVLGGYAEHGVAAALLDGVDLVVLAGARRLAPGDRQRLMARARQRGSVLLAVGRWPGAELEIDVGGARWQGLGGAGAGRLRARGVQVRVGGRGVAHRRHTGRLLLPGPSGAVEPVRAAGPAGPAKPAGPLSAPVRKVG